MAVYLAAHFGVLDLSPGVINTAESGLARCYSADVRHVARQIEGLDQ